MFALSSLFSNSPSSLQAEGGNPKKANSIYEFTAKDIDGNDVSLAKYRGHVCVIVNVASKWGKTDVNYKQLVEMYNKVYDLNISTWVGKNLKLSTTISVN